MVVPATAVYALMRAYRPTFRSRSSKIPFAAHAFLVTSGCTLTGCGSGVEDATDVSEAALDGWDADDTCYQFRYRTPAQKQLILKCLPVDDSVLLHWLIPGTDIKSLEVAVSQYTTDKESIDDAFADLQGLIDAISPGLEAELQDNGTADAAPPASAARGTSAGEGTTSAPRPHPEQPNPQGIYVGEGRPAPDFDDRFPGGIPDPLMIGGGRRGPGGGMHVGPDDPIFANMPRAHPARGTLPPGARYDPIGPPGMPGWNPDDFTLGQSRQDAWNDLGPPPGMGGPPRRGAGGPGFGGGMFG